MNIVTTKNNVPLILSNKLKVCVCPYPYGTEDNLIVLDLARGAELREIATGKESVKDIDAAVTGNRALGLGISTRDCAPVCMSDGTRIGLVHVGWQGFSLGLMEKALRYFDPRELVVYVGPFLNSFEIKKDFCYDALIQKEGTEKYIQEEEGRHIFYFQQALASILPPQTVFDTRNTKTDLTLPSNRRDKNSKGFLTKVWFA